MLKKPDRDILFAKACVQFENGEYFMCHETLEALWLTAPAERLRDSIQGLIHLAAARLHEQRGNGIGQRLQTDKARQKLQSGILIPKEAFAQVLEEMKDWKD